MIGGYLYIAEISGHINLFKIGVSGNLKKRMKALRQQYGADFKLLRKNRFMHAFRFESRAREELERYKYVSPVGRKKRPSREIFKADYSIISAVFDGFSEYTISEESSYYDLRAIQFARIEESINE